LIYLPVRLKGKPVGFAERWGAADRKTWLLVKQFVEIRADRYNYDQKSALKSNRATV
jgi:hypothetical protein